MTMVTAAAVVSRRRSRQRRFLLVTIPGLAVLAVAMGVSFLGNTGTTSASVTAASSNFIFPVADTNSLPSAVDGLEYTHATNIDQTAHTITTAVVPSWAPTAQSAGSVTTPGDLALIDATIASNGVTVSLYVTNLAGLQQDYSSLALPVNIYRSPCTSGCLWTQASGVIAKPPTYLTATSGFLTFNLPASVGGVPQYYDITIDAGGSFYCTATSEVDGGATLSPSYYFTAQPY